jgi:hypothetical protein
MPAKSKKQQRFFGLVRAIQKGDKSASTASPAARKVAGSISAKDAGDFAKSVAELKIKKAVLEILKDAREPMYLEEQETNPVAKTFTIKDDFERYAKRYVGQPFSPKELEALDTFQETKPTKIDRIEIRYETTDEFQNTTSTILKKMKDSGQFCFTAFTKHTKIESEEEPETSDEPTGEPVMGGNEPAPGSLSMKEQQDPAPMDEPKDDIIVTKSTLFNDDIKGAAVLAEFLKKLDL